MQQVHQTGGAATPDQASMAPGGYGPPPGGGYGPPGGGYGPPGGGPPGAPGAPGGYGPPPGGYGPPPGQPPAGYGPAPAMQQPPMPQPGAPGAAPKKGGAGMKVGLALLGVAVVGGGIAAAVMFLGGGGVLPFDAGHLPPKTESIRSGDFKTYVGLRSMLRVDDVPEEATWSTLSAQACGGHDVFGELMSAALGDVEDAITALTRDEARYQEALACGKTLAGDLSSRAGFYSVGFRKGDDYHSVDLLSLGVESLPDSVDTFETKSDPSNMTDTHCKLPWPPKKQKGDKKKKDDDEDAEKPTCEDHTPAVARLEGMDVWATGGLEDLKEFGSKFSPKGENTSDVEPLAKIAGEVKSYDERRVGTGKSFPSISSALGVRVSAFDEEETKELNEMAEKGIEAWALGKKGHFGAGELKIVIVAKSDSRAKDIEGKIKDYLSMIKEKLEEAEKAEEKAKKDKKKGEKDDKDERLVDFFEAKTEIARRTLDDLVLTRDDVRIVLEVVEKVDSDQQAKIDAFLDWRKEKSVVAAKVVRSLLEGEEPSDEDLESLHEDIAGAMKWHKKWPHEPRYAKDGFYVPGNGNFDVKIEDSEILEVYEYDLPRKDLIELTKFLNEKKGWKLKKGSGDEYTAKKDDSELKLTFREEKKKGTIVLGK